MGRTASGIVLDVLDFRRPEWSQDVGVELLNEGIDLGVDRLEVVGPAGEDSAGSDHPSHLGVEPVMVEPVEGVGDGHQIDQGVTEGRPLGEGDELGDLGVGSCLGDLAAVGVGGDDGTEVGVSPRAACPLLVAQSQARSWAGTIEVSEKGVRVRGPGRLGAVGHRRGHLQVVAYAGDGKTKAISRRIAALIEEGIEPSQIVAFTLTDRAAEGLKTRISRRVAEVRARLLASSEGVSNE